MKIYFSNETKSKNIRLVDAFGQRIGFYKSDQYKEANLEDKIALFESTISPNNKIDIKEEL